MKVFITLVAVLLLGVLAFFIIQRSTPASATAITSLLVPADTDVFLTFPDLLATAERWQECPVGQMVASPRLRPFLRRPLAQVFQSAEMSTARRLLQELRVEELWVAARVPAIDQPKWMLAFRARGSQESVDQALRRLQETLVEGTGVDSWSGQGFRGWYSRSAQSGQVPGGGQSLEVWAVQGLGWAVITNDAAWLTDLSERLQDRSPSPSLYDDEEFQKTMRPLDGEADVLFYVAARRVVEKFRAFAVAGGEAPIAEHFAQLERWQTLAFTSLLGTETRERMVLRGPLPTEGKLSPLVQPLAPANTLFLWEGQTDTSWLTGESLALLPPRWRAGLEDAGLDLPALRQAMGHQAGLVLWWPGASLLPAFVGVAEIRDAETVRAQLTRLGGMLAGDAMVTQEGGLTTLSFRADALMGLVSPTLGFQTNRIFLALNPGDLTRSLQTATAGDGWLSTPSGQEVAAFLNRADWQRSYLDVPGLVERMLATLQPLLAFASALNPSLAEAIDVNVLPQAEDLRPFLGPVRTRQNILPGEGVIGETLGAVTWSSLWLAVPAGLPDGWEKLSSVADEEN